MDEDVQTAHPRTVAKGNERRQPHPEPPTEQIEVSPARAYADAQTLPPDLHRIAPQEEVILDGAALRARFASTDEARIAAALDAHALEAPPPTPDLLRATPRLGTDQERHEPTHVVRARKRAPRPAPPSLVWILTLAALGLAAGMGFALLRN